MPVEGQAPGGGRKPKATGRIAAGCQRRAAGQGPCGGRAVADIVIRAVINALAFIAAVYVIPTADFRGDWWKMVAVAAIFGIVNAYLRPIAKLLSLPLNLLTFGLVGLVINIAMVL